MSHWRGGNLALGQVGGMIYFFAITTDALISLQGEERSVWSLKKTLPTGTAIIR
jgi:hypothetical protein